MFPYALAATVQKNAKDSITEEMHVQGLWPAQQGDVMLKTLASGRQRRA